VMVPMLARMYKKRLAGYSALGYTVTEVGVLSQQPSKPIPSSAKGDGG
jgi:hypothetical protein